MIFQGTMDTFSENTEVMDSVTQSTFGEITKVMDDVKKLPIYWPPFCSLEQFSNSLVPAVIIGHHLIIKKEKAIIKEYCF